MGKTMSPENNPNANSNAVFRRSFWLVKITYCMLEGDLITTEWLSNTSLSSPLIMVKLNF